MSWVRVTDAIHYGRELLDEEKLFRNDYRNISLDLELTGEPDMLILLFI